MTPLAPRRAAAVSIAALLTLGLAACSGDGADQASSDAGRAEMSAPEGASEGAAVEGEAGDVAADASVAPDADAVVDREVVVTGYMDLVAPDPSEAVDEITRMVEQAGGRIEGLDESPGIDGEPGAASVTARIPADRTTSAVEAISEVAAVRHVEISKDDVTSQGQDLDARISALTTSTERLTALLAEAGSTADLLEVERELAARQANLDSLTAQRGALTDQVALSTIRISITEDSAPVSAPRSGFVDGLTTGWSALVATVHTIVLVLAVLLPWLALALVGYVIFRLVRRRRRASAPPSGPGSTGGRGDGGPEDGGSPESDGGAPTPDPEREPELANR
jgi:hypothetical protein